MINFEIKNISELPMVWPAGKAGFIAYCDNVFEKEFCQNVINFCEDNIERSHYGCTLSGVKRHIKNSIDWNLDSNYTFPENLEQEIDHRINHELQRVVNLYQFSFTHLESGNDSNYFCNNDTGYQIQKYEKNIGFYSQHIDGASWIDTNGPRTAAAIIYLNTVEYGGGTQFPVQNVTVDAVAGRVAVFPAYWTHPHSGLMPLSSDKWIISTFLF